MKTRKAKATPPQKKYSPKPEERAAIKKFFEERKIAPAPRLKVDGNSVSIDHPNNIIGFVLMENALGTSDGAFANGLLEQLAKATSGGSTVSESDLNFMVSVINGIEPRDQLEAMLAAQMAATHMAMLWFMQHIPRIENLPQQDAAERAINKFARTFAAQMEALKRYRSGGEQKVTVQHVSVGEGGQAIVGNVTQSQRENAPEKDPSPPPALTHSKIPAMEVIAEVPRKAAPVKRKSNK
jgi:hypothetical protein